MLAQKAGAAGTAPRNNRQDESYTHPGRVSIKLERERKIAERRAQIPKLYRGIYDKAISGRSRKAAMHSFCVECCGFQIAEVFNCSDPACPLYPYRPRSRILPVAPQSIRKRAESTKSATGRLWAGE